MFDEFKEETEHTQEQEQPKKSLANKIEELITSYKNLKKENEDLKAEIETLKSENQTKQKDIANLNQKVSSKDTQNDEIFSKIEEVLGL